MNTSTNPFGRYAWLMLCALVISTLSIHAQGQYTLVFNEDFTDASLDASAWNIEINGDGGGNNELQYYCQKAVSLGTEHTTGKKCLILTATKESYSGKPCTSGRVNTQNKLTYTYGMIKARIRMPQTANGLWPAFWQLGNDISSVGWPQCGETDIIEMGHANGINAATQDRFFNGALHLGYDWQSVWHDAQEATWSYSLQDGFHTLTMIWTPTSIDMYMDEVATPYFHAALENNPEGNDYYDRKKVYSKPNFIIANLAVGGNFPNIYTIDGISALASGPRSMYIDWIRIYQRGDSGQTFSTSASSDPIEPDSSLAIEAIETDEAPGSKILHNGQLLIRRGEHIYTLTGQIVR